MCVFVLILAVPLLKGCSSSNGGTEIGNPFYQDLEMGTFSSNQELQDYILDQYAKSVLPQDAYGSSWVVDDELDAGNDGSTEGGSTNDAVSAPDSYSETNVQEAGVDEADQAKTDGRYIYLAGDKTVHIVDTETPSAMNEVSTISVNGYVDSLYLYNDLLVILYTPDNGRGNYWDYAGATEDVAVGFCYWFPVNAETGVKIVDVSDQANPAEKSDTIIEGNLISSRRIENKLYVVQQFLPELPQFDYYYYGNQNKDDVIKANKAKLKDVTLDNLIPYYKTVDKEGKESESTQLVTYEHFYKPSDTSGGSVVTVSTFDLLDLTQTVESTGVIADAHTVYASTSALYVASTRWNDSAYDKNDSLNIYQTYLFKFSFTDDGVVCTGAGSVNGHILNQFSLGEYEDVLRIATTNGESWMGSGTKSSNVYCLKVEDEKLNVIGKIEDIAKGESIYAVRFLGKRGYIVTFVQVDPLFTVDLSDPYHPEIVGELKVPGYSDYIHPLSDNYILTIGQDVNLYQGTPWVQGVQLSIFDVSDFGNPVLLFKENIGDRGTYSEALYNHKAFTYWASNNLLAIPVNLYEVESPAYPYDYGTYKYSGLYVYEISTENGFSHLGTIETGNAYSSYYSTWTRGVFMDDHVFAVQKNAVYSAEYNAISTTTNTLDLTE